MIASAVRERNYAQVAQLAKLAEGLASLMSGAGSEIGPVLGEFAEVNQRSLEDVAPNDKGSKGNSRINPKRERGKSASDDYPRFERQRDRLIKIGWSKKDGSEYEHRAPLGAVHAVASAVVEIGKRKKCFEVDDALPIKGADGSEIPSYQTYLVLAWLRESGVVERQGKDGYRLVNVHEFDDLWSQTPERD